MTTSVYIHIPFCEHLCTYCDFAKRFYNEAIAFEYLDALKKEIKKYYKGELLKTIYVGGGTPSSLSVNNLLQLSEIIRLFNKEKNCEFTFEINPENIDLEKLHIIKNMGVNRISIGVESTIPKFLNYLGRHHDFSLVKEKVDLIKSIGITNINVDLIYAIPQETIKDLKKDLDNILSLDINHISTYSLEIHENTLLGIKKERNISEDLDSDMYYYIVNYLKDRGFYHYEVSNFCKNNDYSRHNLVYWHNEEYYGFGLGACGYVKDIRYQNTKNMSKYIKEEFRIVNEIVNINDKISYELILGFRLINGINKKDFYKKYHREITEMYNINDLIQRNYLQDDGFYIKIKEDKIYVENSILENFID